MQCAAYLEKAATYRTMYQIQYEHFLKSLKSSETRKKVRKFFPLMQIDLSKHNVRQSKMNVFLNFFQIISFVRSLAQ